MAVLQNRKKTLCKIEFNKKYKYNLSLNKFPVWHIDGTTVVKYIWFLDSTNLQTLSVKISWQSDV